jgi:thiazole/oxazole-forming peptide maturase SagD family component
MVPLTRGTDPHPRRQPRQVVWVLIMLDINPLDLQEPATAAALAGVPEPLRLLLPKLSRAFTIKGPAAPGFVCVGAELEAAHIDLSRVHLSVTGTGLDLTVALTSLLGEAAERLSQVERWGDVVPPDPVRSWAGGWIGDCVTRTVALNFAEGAATGIDWVNALVPLSTPGVRGVQVPADCCINRAAHQIPRVGAISAGAAAGPTLDAATLSGILELIERDAAALWWIGGSDPAAADLDAAGVALLAKLRAGQSYPRDTRVLDLTTNLGIPVVAAISLDQQGKDLACGLAARLTMSDAVSAALFELCQMELAAPLAAMKYYSSGSLSDSDRRHLARASWDASGCALLAGGVHSRAHVSVPAVDLTAHLLGRGVRIAVVDLTRDEFAIPAVKVLSPDLQPLAPWPVTPRLANAIASTGSDAAQTDGIELM